MIITLHRGVEQPTNCEMKIPHNPRDFFMRLNLMDELMNTDCIGS